MIAFPELQQQIREALFALPTITEKETRQALVETAGLDRALRQQIDCSQASANFVPHLVGACSRYGNLADGRDALEAILDAAKAYINVSQRVACDQLIALLRVTPRPVSQKTDALASETEQAPTQTNSVTQIAGDHAIQIGQARDVTITR